MNKDKPCHLVLLWRYTCLLVSFLFFCLVFTSECECTPPRVDRDHFSGLQKIESYSLNDFHYYLFNVQYLGVIC